MAKDTSKKPVDDPLLTMADVMTLLNLSRTKVWQMIHNDELPAFKFGGDYRFRKSEIMQWMELFRIQKTNSKPSKKGETK